MPSRTKNAIKASFLRLLDQKPLNQITVKDIVEDCGVNRNSFYYHFDDIPTMLAEIVTERTDAIIEQYPTADSLEECLKAIIQFAKENRRAVFHIYRSASRELVEDYLIRTCHHTVERYAEIAIGDARVSEGDREILIRFFECELLGQSLTWLNSGMSYDIEGQFERLCQIMHGLTEALVRRCADGAEQPWDAPSEKGGKS